MTAAKGLMVVLQPLVRRVRTDVTAIKRAVGSIWTTEPLTEARLVKHLNGGPARGVSPIKEGQSVTMVAVLDLDDHKVVLGWDGVVIAAAILKARLAAIGVRAVPFRSRGGKGIHLIMIWEEPQDAYSVRQALKAVLAGAGYRDGTGGLSEGQVEVFPKQDEVPMGGHGNQFILPLSGESTLLAPELEWEPVSAEGLVWEMSDPVVVLERPTPRPVVVVPADAARAARALMAIPNTGAGEFPETGNPFGLDRKRWFDLLCGFREAGGEEAVALRWSEQHASHDEKEFVKTWESIKVGKPGGIPGQYLYDVAENHGWREQIEEELFGGEFDKMTNSTQPPAAQPWPTFPRDKAGKIAPTVTNVMAAVGCAGMIGMRLAQDLFRADMLVGDVVTDDWRPFVDTDVMAIRMALERNGFKPVAKELVRDAAVAVAARNEFDTAIKWANSLVWDGVPRVERFLETYMGCLDTPYVRAVSLYMWTALAGRCLVAAIQADMAPIFQGSQGLRKTSLIQALVPAIELYAAVDLKDKEQDTIRALRGVLVAEIEELSGLHTRDLDTIKKFISRRIDKWVAKYKEFADTFRRRCLFIGSTNVGEILADITGNRRWLPVTVTMADVEGVVRDRLQLWAEAIVLFRAGGIRYQEAERLAEFEHQDFMVVDEWEQPIRKWLESDCLDLAHPPGTKKGDVPFRMFDMLIDLGIDITRQDMSAQKRVAKVLSGLGYERKVVRLSPTEIQKCWIFKVTLATLV